MSGINQNIFVSVCRIRVTFRDDLGNAKAITGTGFWIAMRPHRWFVTNRHNVDPKMKAPHSTIQLEKVEIQLRRQDATGLLTSEVDFFGVQNLDCLKQHPTADAAVFVNPSLHSPGYTYGTLDLVTEIGDEPFITRSVRAMDVASFIGFPGASGKPWWDEQWELPIARVVNIASSPHLPFTNSAIKTANVTLVSGLSFSGSSGSPVVLHEKGVQVGHGLSGGNYIAPRVIGIMSGHWDDDDVTPGSFRHSGLSYYTRSQAFLELMC